MSATTDKQQEQQEQGSRVREWCFAPEGAQVHLACSKDELRPVLTGISFRKVNGAMHIVATDSFHLVGVPCDDVPESWDGAIVPAPIAKEWMRKPKRGESRAMLTIEFSGGYVSGHRTGTVTVGRGAGNIPRVEQSAALITGTFPDIGGLVPGQFFDGSAGQEPTVSVFGVNPDYLANVQKALGGKQGVKVAMLGDTRPLFVKVRSDKDTYLPGFGLVMPIRVS